MRPLLFLPLLLAPLGSTIVASRPAPDTPQLDKTEVRPVAWQTDLNRATELAAERDRPLMIVFR